MYNKVGTKLVPTLLYINNPRYTDTGTYLDNNDGLSLSLASQFVSTSSYVMNYLLDVYEIPTAFQNQ